MPLAVVSSTFGISPQDACAQHVVCPHAEHYGFRPGSLGKRFSVPWLIDQVHLFVLTADFNSGVALFAATCYLPQKTQRHP